MKLFSMIGLATLGSLAFASLASAADYYPPVVAEARVGQVLQLSCLGDNSYSPCWLYTLSGEALLVPLDVPCSQVVAPTRPRRIASTIRRFSNDVKAISHGWVVVNSNRCGAMKARLIELTWSQPGIHPISLDGRSPHFYIRVN